MHFLKENFSIVSLAQIYEQRDLDTSRLNIAITFDDGFREHARLAAPVLHDFEMPATFFIPSTSIGASSEFTKNIRRNGNFEFVTVDDVRTLAADPLFTIGGHTMNHADLGKSLSSHDLQIEINEDRRRLQDISGQSVDFFAYPFGSPKNVHPSSMEAIRSEYKAAFTIIPAFWNPHGNRFAAGRDSMSLTDSNDLWNAWLKGGYDFVSRLKGTV